MESQGPSLSKGFPNQETGAQVQTQTRSSNDKDKFQLQDEEPSEGAKNIHSPNGNYSESLSSPVSGDQLLSIQENQSGRALGEKLCESGESTAEQSYFTIPAVESSNSDGQLTHFHDGSNDGNDDRDEGMEISLEPRSVYGNIADKDVDTFHGTDEVGHDHLDRENINLQMNDKAEFSVISVEGRVVPQHVRNLHPFVPNAILSLSQRSSKDVVSNHSTALAEVSSSTTQDASVGNKMHGHGTGPKTQDINQTASPGNTLSDTVLLPDQGKGARGITIDVYSQDEEMSLVTSNSILSANMSTFSSQVPTMLTEGDTEDSELHCDVSDQFHVITTSSVMSQGDSNAALDVMTSSTDFGRSVILTEQQQVLLTGMLVNPAASANQGLHINVSHEANTCMDVDHESHLGNQSEQPSGEKRHVCPHPDCNKVCEKAYKLKLHMLAHTGERPYKCPQEGCEWAFTTAYKLKRHIRGHTGEKPFMCAFEGCGKYFTTAYNLKTHYRVHYRTDSHVCSYKGCSKTFATGHRLTAHERKHQQGQKLYSCELEGCGKVFTSVATLRAHIRKHTGVKPHLCPVEGCEKRFTKASKLKLHLRSHTGERPFSCEVEGCGWSFTSAYKLKRHMRKHTGERPFLCSYGGCCKSFTRSSHLKTHMLVHTGDKPYECPVEGCNKAFTAGSSLNVHMCRHTGHKPFKCEVHGCGKAYTTAANLRAHQKRHGGNNLPGVEYSGTLHGDSQEGLCTVSCGSATSETEAEVTYTAIGSFPHSEFNLDDASRLTSAGVPLPSSSTSLCALVASAGQSLSSPSAEAGLDSEGKHLEEDNCSARRVEPVPTGLQRERFVSESMDDNPKLDVAEFVVRSEERDMISHRAQQRAPDTVLDSATKLAEGFDLCVTSMMSHITSESGVYVPSSCAVERLQPSVVSSNSKQSTALDFRDVHPEDQFAPPAVIFQDEVKTSDTEPESDVIVAHIQQSPDGMPLVPVPQHALQISIPVQLPPSLESATATVHLPNVERIEVDNEDADNPSLPAEIRLGSISSSPGVHEGQGGLGRSDMSPYMEQEEGNGDTYPESTINLQDLR